MFALGVILILLAAGALVLAVVSTPNTPATFELGGVSVAMEPLWVFLAGALTVLLLVLGLELVRAGARRASKRRKEKKELNRLAEKLEAREADGTTTTTTQPAATGTTSTPSATGSTSSPATTDTTVDTPTTRTDGDVTDPHRPPQ